MTEKLIILKHIGVYMLRMKNYYSNLKKLRKREINYFQIFITLINKVVVKKSKMNNLMRNQRVNFKKNMMMMIGHCKNNSKRNQKLALKVQNIVGDLQLSKVLLQVKMLRDIIVAERSILEGVPMKQQNNINAPIKIVKSSMVQKDR